MISLVKTTDTKQYDEDFRIGFDVFRIHDLPLFLYI